MFIVIINSKKCKGCGLCIQACPKQCISYSKQFNKIGYHWAVMIKKDACTGCSFCYMVCPDICIKIYEKAN